MKISLIQPGRNNLKYLKWAYAAIRKNQGSHDVEICVADDASTDGTWQWCQEMMAKDDKFKAILNDTGKRLGHTILYDRLINNVASNHICMIYHADMYLMPGALDAIEREIADKTIVSLTRIEPPLHPDGPEKVLLNCGVEPEEFKEQVVLDWYEKNKDATKITEGIFAPWAFYKKDFQEIGGHDPLYAPQSKEDSDIFNRFQLNGVKFKQVWDGFVYHMTSRGSRRNTLDKAKNIYEDSPEWLAQNMRSTRNFIRKWGHFVMHDALLNPIVPPKYNVGIVLKNAKEILLNAIEPWADNVYVDIDFSNYIQTEQTNTVIDLSKRVLPINSEVTNDIILTIDCNTFKDEDFIYIQKLSRIIKDSGQVGKFKLGNIDIEIKQLTEYTNDLIKI